MDPSELDGLVLRLVTNPQDEQALVLAHHEGESDPAGYAALLERVAQETQDPAYASHWLAEAATIWSTTLGDSHRAARLLMEALDLDPSQQTAHNRLADLYRESDDIKALVALLEQRARVLSPSTEDPEVCAELSALHVELGRLWGERVGQPKKALENFRRALELDATNAFAIYSARELFKASGRIHEALAMYEAEIAIADPDRKVVLLRDEAATRRDAGDFVGATYALVRAHSLAPDDPELTHEAGSSILARIEGGEDVPPEERMGGANLFVDLADRYDGDAGLAYAGTALDLAPSHDRALQLYLYFATALERTDDAKVRAAAYLAASPRGALRDEATRRLAPSPAPSSPPREIPAPARYNTEDPTLDGSDPFPLRPDTLPPVSLVVVLEQAHALATKGRKGEALAKYKQVLDADPAHPEALRWVEDHLRTRRDHASLRDVLMSAVHAMPASAATLEMRRRRLREVASLCEGNLRDLDGAILAHQQLYALDPTDTAARTSLERLFERVHRWDELASLFEQQASLETLAAKKIALEKHAAQIHETRRQDLIAAAEAWTRIASLASDDPASLATAAQLYERAERPSLAADVLAEGVHSVRPGTERVQLCERLGALREQHGAWLDAGDAYLQAAEASRQAQHWEMAERAFVKASAWGQAAHAAEQLASIAPHAEAPHLTRAAEHMIHAGDHAGAEEHLIHAVAIDPSNDRYAARLTEVLDRSAKWTLLASVLAKRAAAIDDPSRRIAERRNVARLYAAHGAPAIARSAWLDVLNDGDDVDALEALAADASADPAEAAAFLRRRLSLTAPADRADVARRLVSLYDRLGDRDGAIDALEQILAADPEDFDVLVRLADLCEEAEKWTRVAELLARRVEVEADESEAAAAAKRRAEILEVRLGREDDALASLEELADHGVQELRDAYVALADRLGWKGLIASKLVHWWLAAPPSPERTSALVEAFHCFVGVDRVEEACRVGLELARGITSIERWPRLLKGWLVPIRTHWRRRTRSFCGVSAAPSAWTNCYVKLPLPIRSVRGGCSMRS
ncbi:MAG: tetratricopeptide repeat protein [Myxococcales bacterium]